MSKTFDIESLDAAQFANLVAQVGRLFGVLNEVGVIQEITSRAKASGEMSEAESTALVVDLIGNGLPKLIEADADVVYSTIAACKGQTLAEYKEQFSVRGAVRDIKELITFLSEEGLDFLSN